MAEERVERPGVESRAVGTGAFAGLTVPQYLTDLVAPAARAMRPTADICSKHQLPADGLTVNISRITTATAAAAQATENSAVQETNMDDTLLTVNVRTYAGQQTVSRQAIDRGTGVGEVVLADLVRSYHTKLDDAILNADGTSGTHLGIRSTGSIISVTYTDASPTAAEAYPKLFDLIQQVQAGVFMGVSHFIMHPRRWWWFASQVGTSFPFITPVNAGVQQGGSVTSREYGQISGYIAGVPVIVDGNMATNLGGGTEDVIIGVTAEELHLWEDAGSPLYISAEQTSAASLGQLLVVYGYSAFTAGRYPGAAGIVTGTGLAAPTFA
jgi:HK97 family phage major capsid protein